MGENPSDLVGKEFIFEYGLDRILPPSEKTGGTFALEQRAYRRERVVRCRDCVHWRRPSDRERSRCTGAMAFVEPSPDGFCAWAKEREA